MAITQCFIQFISDSEAYEQATEFFASQTSTKDDQAELLGYLRELLHFVIPPAKAVTLTLQVQMPGTGTLPMALKKLLTQKRKRINASHLSKRETEIMSLIAQGFINKEIAGKLFISLETVKSHRKHLLLKTGSKNTAMLITYYNRFLVNT